MLDTDIFQAITRRSLADVRKILLRHRNAANKVDAMGRTPLMHMAVSWATDDDKIIELLVERGAKVNATDFGGRMALHHAAASGNDLFIDTLQELAGEEVFYHVPDHEGSTPVDMALNGDDMAVLISMAQGRFRRLDVSQRDTHLAIVGVGPAGAALFISLVNKLFKWREEKLDFEFDRVSIYLIDRHKELGTGTPYSLEQNSPTSLLNVAAGGMSIDASDPMDFVNWIEEKAETGELVNLLGPAHDHGLCAAQADPLRLLPANLLWSLCIGAGAAIYVVGEGGGNTCLGGQ